MRMQKSKKLSAWPTLEKIQEQATRDFGTDLAQLLTFALNKIIEDISSVQTAPDVVDSLPTADASLRGRIFVLRGGAGVADTISICRKNAADAYEFYAL